MLLRAWDKRSLVGNYEKAAKEVIDDWEKVFGTRSAHSAAEIGDYYSGVFRDVDLEEE